MHVTVPIYQTKRANAVTWTTIGLGRFTRARTGTVPAKVQQSLIADLKTAIEAAAPSELVQLAPKRGTRLVRVRLELTLTGGGSKRKVSGLFPLIVEPRSAGPDRPFLIAYHPLRQDDWFPVKEGQPLESLAAAALGKLFADLDEGVVAAIVSNEKDLLKPIAFSAQPRSLLDDLRAKERGIWDDLLADPTKQKPKKRTGGLQTLPSLGTDLTSAIANGTAGDLGAPRSPYRELLSGLLSSPEPKAVVVVGDPSVGKTTLVRQWIKDQLELDGYAIHRNLDRVTHVWSLAGKRLIAGMSYVGDWEQRCIDVLEDIRGKKIVLFVPDLFRFGRIGRARQSDRNLADFFRGPLARGEMVIVAEATSEQLQILEEDAPAFAQLFVRVPIEPATPAEAFRLLVHESRTLEADHPVAFSPYALRTILEVGASLGPERALPGKVLDLLRSIAEKSDAAASEERPLVEIGPPEVIDHLAESTGLPRALLSPDAPLASSDLEARLSSEVLGQPIAVRVASDVILRMKAGICDPRRPAAVLLFTGPTGTGKTELAKCLAAHLFGSRDRLVRFDMSELNGPDAAARLVGDAVEPEGQLTRAVRQQPLAVVLLDEIDKAHPSVLNLLLQLFDDGRLTDAAGDTASFTGTVIVMTSNLGASQRDPLGFGVSREAVLFDVAKAVREFFPPELFNRIDRVVPFGPLSRAVAVDVAEKELARLCARPGLESRNVFVRSNRAVVERVAEEAFKESDGARSLKRYLEDRIGAALSEAIARSPRAVLRLLYLFDAPETHAGFVLVDEALEEADALTGVRYVLEALLSEPIEELRARVAALPPRLDALAGPVARAMKDAAPTVEGSTRRYWIERLLDAIDAERRRALELAGAAPRTGHAPIDRARSTNVGVADAEDERDDDDDRWGVFESGKGRDHTRVRVRLKSNASPSRVTGSREQHLATLARVESLERFARDIDDPDANSVTIELCRAAASRTGAREDGPSFLAWLALAYVGAGVELERAAVLQGDAVTRCRDRDALERALTKRSADLVVLDVAGLGARDALFYEQGCHVWTPLGSPPEIVRVRVLPRDDISTPEARAKLFVAERRAFDDAIAGSAGAMPPGNPAKLTSLVRKIRFDPPAREGAPAPVEIEDYVMGYFAEISARSVADALGHVWLLRSSRRSSA